MLPYRDQYTSVKGIHMMNIKMTASRERILLLLRLYSVSFLHVLNLPVCVATARESLHNDEEINQVIDFASPTTVMSLVLPIGRAGPANSHNHASATADMPTLSAFRERQKTSETRMTSESRKHQRKMRKLRQRLCRSLPGLVRRQYKMCMDSPELVAAAVDGTAIAISECERQFKYERWNCSLLMRRSVKEQMLGNQARGNALDLGFGNAATEHDILSATRESAFVHAILGAGIAHAVTTSCKRGELPGCHCDMNVSKLNLAMKVIGGFISSNDDGSNDDYEAITMATLNALRKRKLYGASNSMLENRTWTLSRNSKGQIALVDDLKKISWGGCSDDVRFGIRFSRKFLEAPYRGVPKKQRKIQDDVKLHNGEVGRRIVQELTRVHCRCHGMSGACTSQTCWLQMPTFQEVGNALKRKYMDGAVRARQLKRRRRLRHVTDSARLRTVPKTQLAFLNDTPNLCFRNESLGVEGTVGRQCLKNSDGRGGCKRLCCGRGHAVKKVVRQWNCKCKFFFCCRVECDTCVETRNVYTCR